jgi:tetratricopeptide (TPR) repeat protein
VAGVSAKKPDDLMKISPWLAVAALLVLVFTLATSFAPHADEWTRRQNAGGFMGMLLGDSRQLFANQSFTEADVYFHSGFYPSIFDQNAEQQKEIITASHGSKESEEDEKKEDFLGKPKDWIDAFGRNFRITRHMHLENGNEREILPWLRLAADLNPHKVEVYTVGAFFLFDHLKRPEAAASFLREGLQNNPGNCDILFTLGRVYYQGFHDASRARNVWNYGLEKYAQWPEEARQKNELIYEELAGNLAKLEAAEGNYPKAIALLESVQKVSPAPDAVQVLIDDLKKKERENASPTTGNQPH